MDFELQIVGWIGVAIFAVSLVSYLAFSLPRCGRLARSNESLSYKVTCSELCTCLLIASCAWHY